MVSLRSMRASLEDYKNHPGLVAVFLGGTSGIGHYAARAISGHAESASIYIVGRKAAAAEKIIAECSALSPSSRFEFIQQDVALLRDVDKVAARIKERETKVDVLFMTPDYLDFGPRNETAEGIDTLLSLRYYTRMRLTTQLLPLLSASPHGRVVSILTPWYVEYTLHLDDLGLKRHYGVPLNFSHAAFMTTFFFEELAIRNPSVSFLHVFPGSIWTPSIEAGHLRPLTKWIFNWVVRPLIWFWIQSDVECGDRMAFLCGSGMMPSREAQNTQGAESGSVKLGVLGMKAGQKVLIGSDGNIGSGSYCLDSGAAHLNNSYVVALRKKDAKEKVWEHTMEVFSQIEC